MKRNYFIVRIAGFIAAACTRIICSPENNGKDAHRKILEQTQGYKDRTILMFTLSTLLHSAPLWMMNKALKALLSELPSAGAG